MSEETRKILSETYWIPIDSEKGKIISEMSDSELDCLSAMLGAAVRMRQSEIIEELKASENERKIDE